MIKQQLIILLIIIILIIWVIESKNEFFINTNDDINNNTNKIIIPDIIGGLGNQLFIIASAFSFAKDHNYNLMLDDRKDVLSYGKPRPIYNDNVFIKLQVINNSNNTIDFININESDLININESDNIKNKINNKNIYLTGGYYQEVTYFDKYRNELLDLLEPTDEINNKINEIIKINNINLDKDFLVAIHVRLDDVYTPIDEDKRVYDQEEYDILVSKLPEHLNNNPNTKFIIFSNNIPRTKDIFSKIKDPNINNSKMIYIQSDDYVELFLMAKCNDYIASPSTFNWWGIYLNKNYKKSKIYIYWKQDSNYRKDFYNKYTYFDNLIDYYNQKITFITFGGPTENFHKRVKEISRQAESFNLFNNIIGFTEKDLQNDKNFWNKHGNFIENNKRGYGYWLWKSYIILKTLNEVNNNDIILYCDTGCHLIQEEKSKLLEYIDILNKSKYGILSFEMGWPEKQWNKCDVLTYFNGNNKIDIEKIKNSGQHHATFMLIKKNDHSINLINKWYELCSNYHFIDDSPSVEKNDETFDEHRHDQSIFSLLVKTYGSAVLPAGSSVIVDARDKG